jgi:hypothetical protein
MLRFVIGGASLRAAPADGVITRKSPVASYTATPFMCSALGETVNHPLHGPVRISLILIEQRLNRFLEALRKKFRAPHQIAAKVFRCTLTW